MASSSLLMENIVDQLQIMLTRETKYEREDYIGCFLAEATEEQGHGFSVIPRDNSVDAHIIGATKPSEDALFQGRRYKKSKIQKNNGVISEEATKTKRSTKPLFSEYHRTKLCEWAVEVVNFYSFPMEAVEVTMNILDRYLALHVPAEKRTMDTLHLLTLTSLYLALKLVTMERPAPQIFVRLARSKFTVEQVEETELRILQGLDWLVQPPTAEDFCKHYCCALSDIYAPDVLERMQVEALLSIRSTLPDYVWVRFSPSVVAMGALSWSLHQLGVPDRYPSPLAELYKCGLRIHQVETMQCLDYFYLRATYAESGLPLQEDLPKFLRKRAAPTEIITNKAPRNSLSPVSIIKDNPVVIQDEEEDL